MKQFPGVQSRGLKWENKTYKLKVPQREICEVFRCIGGHLAGKGGELDCLG